MAPNDWKPSEWADKGSNDTPVPMTVAWNEELDAFEFTSLAETYTPNVKDWQMYLDDYDSKIEEIVGPLVTQEHFDETKTSPYPDTGETQRWWRISGPAARDMYDAAMKRKHIDAPGMMADAVDAIEMAAGGGDGTVYRWREEGFEFWAPKGLTGRQVNQWKAAVSKAGGRYSAFHDETIDRDVYRVEGEIAAVLYQEAEKSRDAVEKKDLGEGGDPTGFTMEALDRMDARTMPTMPDSSLAEPDWEGSPSFSNSWRSTAWMIENYHHAETGILTGLGVVTLDARTALYNAHPIVIPPEQTRVIPSMEVTEAVEYLQQVRLPFDPLYFDTSSGPSPNQMSHVAKDVDETRLGLAGGTIQTNPERPNDRQVIPFGATILPKDSEAERLIDEFEKNGMVGRQYEVDPLTDYGKSWGFCLSDFGSNGLPSHAPMASILISPDIENREYEGVGIKIHAEAKPEPLERLWTMKPRGGQLEFIFVGGEVVDGPRSMAMLLPIPDIYSYQQGTLEEAKSRIEGWAVMAAARFEKLVALLQFIESHNVEIVQAKVSRQVRRQAERKGRELALTVYIRHRKSTATSNGDGAKLQFSHSFEVMGNTHHVTRGSHVWCKKCQGEGEIEGPVLPDGSSSNTICSKCDGLGLDKAKITPCARRDQDGNLTCPKGCRKEWVPSFVKGEGPLVMKARKQTG